MIRTFVSSASARLTPKQRKILLSWEVVFALVVAQLLFMYAFDFSDMFLAAIGGATCFVWQHRPKSPRRTKAAATSGKKTEQPGATTAPAPWKKPGCAGDSTLSRHQRQQHSSPASSEQICWQPSSVPVLAPQFKSADFDAEVRELLDQIVPSVASDTVVAKLLDATMKSVKEIFPEAEVVAFACGNPASARAFAVAVPEIDIVVNATSEELERRLHNRLSKGHRGSVPLDPRGLQKSAVRACADQLVAFGGFKFRRSAFRGVEPKVTLLAPVAMGSCDTTLAFDVSVNTTTPLRQHTLLTECGRVELRAKELTLLVRRWARDRGVSHAQKGHLSPYAWSLLAAYFLQVGVEEGPLLPAFEEFDCSCTTARKKPRRTAKTWRQPPESASARTATSELFKDFIRFYARDFDWRKECVSLQFGCRMRPAPRVPNHAAPQGGYATEVEAAPTIQDPFDVSDDLGKLATSYGLARAREELARADELCTRSASLSEILTPWAPPEPEVQGGCDGAQDDDGDSGSREEREPRAAQPGSLSRLEPRLLKPSYGMKGGSGENAGPR